MRVLALAAALLLVSACGSVVPTTPAVGSPTRPATAVASPTPSASGLAHFQGDGWSFDHPAAWRFSKVDAVSSFSDTIGYLGTIGVDPNAICQHTTNSVSCNARGYDLPPGNVVVLIAHWGTPMLDPVEFYDHPTDGTRVSIAGMPAIWSLQVVGADRVVLTWQIARPDAFGNWIQFDADIRGPDQAAMGRQVDALIASFRFEPPPVPLAAGQAAAIAVRAVAALVAMEPGAYACFPDRPGVTKSAQVLTLPMRGSFSKPLPVSCAITIAATDVGLWRMELVASWTAADDRSAGSDTTVQWLFPDGSLSASSGGGGDAPY